MGGAWLTHVADRFRRRYSLGNDVRTERVGRL